MSTSFVAPLPDRGVLQVSGYDARAFLHGLVTNDVEALKPGEARFAALLSPQGKILFDFFIYGKGESLLLDCPAAQLSDLIKRLSIYKLRAKVVIEDVSSQFVVAAFWGESKTLGLAPVISAYADPRYEPMGWRLLVPREEVRALAGLTSAMESGADQYHAHRIALAVPEGGKDYTFGDTFPHEACYDQLNGVDFNKGCYVGQEVVSRMQHRGTARTRIIAVEADGPLASGSDVTAGDYPIGKLGSVSGHRAIALVRLDRATEALEKGGSIDADGTALALKRPPWAKYEFPEIKVRA